MVAFGDPRREPAAWLEPEALLDQAGGLGDQPPLVALRQHALPLGIAAAVADNLVAACNERLDQRRGIVEHGAVDQH